MTSGYPDVVKSYLASCLWLRETECSSLDRSPRWTQTLDMNRVRVLVMSLLNDTESHSVQVTDIHRAAENSSCMDMVRLVSVRIVGSTPSLTRIEKKDGLCTM